MNDNKRDCSGAVRDALTPRSRRRRDVLRLAGAAGISTIVPSFLIGCSGSTDSAPTYAAAIAAARNAMLGAVADPAVPSISAALVDGERIIWAEAFGTIDKTSGAAPDTETMFGIGSVSKTIAAVATMILVDRNLVQLDAPLARYVSDFRMASPEYNQITVRMLLSHSSGFPGSDYRNASTAAAYPAYLAGMRQALTTMRLKHAPGEMAVYCNDGFTMIEALVAAVTGKPFTQFVQDEIFTPLGMSHTRYPLSAFASGSYAPGYTAEAREPQEFLNVLASGAVYSTPSDMGRLAMMLINGGQFGAVRILSARSVAEMGRDQTGALPLNPTIDSWRFGLGWDDVAHTGLGTMGITAWQKGGDSGIYHSLLMVAPDARLAFFVAATASSYPRYEIAERVLLQAMAERGSIAGVPAPLPATPLPAATPTDAALATVAGYYANSSSVLRVVAQPDRTVTLSTYAAGAWSDTATGLKLRNDGTFSSDAKPLASYRAADSGAFHYLIQRAAFGLGHYLIEFPHAQRLQPKAAASAAWQARIGKRWLAVNSDPSALNWPSGDVLIELTAVPELPGYVLAGNVIVDATGSDTLATMFLKIPVLNGRDLNDVSIEKRSGEEWLRNGSNVSRPFATVPVLGAGSATILLGAEGYAEWRKLPIVGTVTIAGATAWFLYDSDFELKGSGSGSGSAPLPGAGAAAYLVVFGNAGAAITVTIA